ncbi:hypothetical protein JOD82_002009 [Paenibacillus sp. 1182]|uniref:hypothetical protein n=1 Tax=Paenibacillus sp. 1182 TaxID=2806565 RepID=UPI001AE36752|nr:hypothetical protein [Paenibacillus sp. 1182]MBP1308989.1 hypothetical protein [Paenibacillus sp. 1182]
MRKQCRYVLNGCAVGSDPISDFRLIAGNNVKSKYDGSIALRVNIPADLELTKYSCDPYSTTNDKRTLDELGYDVLVWREGKWKVVNQYKGTRPCDIPYHVARINHTGGS